MEETVFSKIIKGEIPCVKIYEDEDNFAFLDINPNTKGHTLVITKEPYENILKVPEDKHCSLMKAIIKVTKAVKEGTGAAGVNVYTNCGKEAGQEVFHLHFHIIPRYNKKEFPLFPNKKYESENEKNEIAKKIINSF